MSETSARKDVQKLQRAIVDGLEDVKAHDIRVFNTEHLTPLFERVVVATGTSNRQTKALAASVRDKVRESGFAKPRVEGEDNGEWIIVDCGTAVAHIMQPAIRQYYNLEEIWGEKPVRLRSAAPDKAKAEAVRAPAKPKAARQAAEPLAANKSKPKRAPVRADKARTAIKNAANGKTVPAKRGAPAKAAAGARTSATPPHLTLVVNRAPARAAPKPAAKSAAKPAAKSIAKPAARTGAKAAAKAAAKPAAKKTTPRRRT